MPKQIVCLDARLIGFYGIGTYLRHLIPFFRCAPLQLHLLVFAEERVHWEPFSWAQITKIKASIYSADEQIELPCKIPRCELFWSPHYNIPLLPIRARKRVVTIHDAYPLVYYHQLTPLQKLYTKIVLPTAARRSDVILTNSNFSKEQLLTWMPGLEGKCRVIPLGVDREVFTEKDQGDEQVLDRLKIRRPFFIMVGCGKAHKNVRLVYEAIACLHQKQQLDFSLIIVGKTTSITPEANLSKASAIQRVGVLSDVELAALYRQAQALIYPSLYEGFGLPPLEAMSAGCPVIASNTAAIPEVCGNAVRYVDPQSKASLVAALLDVRNDEKGREAWRQKGLIRCAEFSWKACADRHLHELQQVMA